MSSGSFSHTSLGETAGPRLAPPVRVESRPGLTRNVGDGEGVVRFDDAPHGGTLLRVEMRYDPPAGVVGDRIAGLFGRDLDAEVAEDIRRFKDRLEAGEVPTSGV